MLQQLALFQKKKVILIFQQFQRTTIDQFISIIISRGHANVFVFFASTVAVGVFAGGAGFPAAAVRGETPAGTGAAAVQHGSDL